MGACVGVRGAQVCVWVWGGRGPTFPGRPRPHTIPPVPLASPAAAAAAAAASNAPCPPPCLPNSLHVLLLLPLPLMHHAVLCAAATAPLLSAQNEIMSSSNLSSQMVVSTLTLSVLEDSGWYSPRCVCMHACVYACACVCARPGGEGAACDEV